MQEWPRAGKCKIYTGISTGYEEQTKVNDLVLIGRVSLDEEGTT